MAALTPEQIQGLQDVKATGAVEVEFADRRVRYRDLSELNSIISEAEASGGEGEGAGSSSYRRQYMVMTSKGL